MQFLLISIIGIYMRRKWNKEQLKKSVIWWYYIAYWVFRHDQGTDKTKRE